MLSKVLCCLGRVSNQIIGIAGLVAVLFVAGCASSGGNAPFAVTTTSGQLATVVINSAYPQATLAAANGTAPYMWAWSGNTPPGMSLSTAGVLSGTPTSFGTFSFTVTVTDSATPTPHMATANLSVLINPALKSVSLNSASATGGSTDTATVTLNGAAAAAASVTLSSSSPSATVPTTVTVAAGQTTAQFQVMTTGVSSSTPATITATYGVAQNAALTINQPTVSSVVIASGATPGGGNLSGTVTLSGPAAAGGDIVALSSNNAAAQVPATATVPAGATSVGFTVTTVPVTVTVDATITASYNSSSQTAPVDVTAPTVSSVVLGSGSTVGGTGVTGTVTLSSVAATGGDIVTLSSNSGAATVPATVTVAAGQTSAQFSVSTVAVASNATATIQATFNSVSKTAMLTVQAPTVASLVLSPTAVTGGTGVTSTATVTLTSAAAAVTGDTVTLSSGNTNAAGVPASIVVPAGLTSVTFVVSAPVQATIATSVITATFNGSSKTATLTNNPPLGLTSIVLTSNSLLGGTSTQGTVTLNQPAPSGGATVTLSSNNAAASVPATVVIAQGSTSMQFTVSTVAVSSNATAQIQGSVNGSNAQATLTVNAPGVASLQLAQASVVGGNSVTVTVTLTGPAAGTGDLVSITTTNSAATVPATVLINPGATAILFSFSTSVVSTTATGNVVATFNGTNASAALSITPPVDISTLTINTPTSVLGGVGTTATVTLTQPAPTGGAVVALSSGNTAAATVPASVTVAAGSTTSAAFAVTTLPVSANTTAQITGSINSTNASGTVTVQAPTVVSVVLVQASVIGGNPVTATVTLSGAAAATTGDSVALTSSNTGVATVPASVNVAPGATTAQFSVTTVTVASTATSSIQASFNSSSQSSVLSVTPPVDISTVVINTPTSVIGGTGTTGKVTLTQPAPTGGAVVTLSSNHTSAASVPASVTVLAGATTATFNVTTSAVAANITVQITASINGTNTSSNVTVQAPTISAVTLNPNSVVGGNSATATVTLIGPAATGGITISITSDNANAQVPSPTVVVSAGSSSVQFTVTSSVVTSTATANIGASFNSSSMSAALSVTTVPSCNSGCTISGTVTGPIASGVAIALTGPASANTTTNSSGFYSFTGLAGGTYTVTPTLAGYAFSPSAPSVPTTGSTTTQNFTETSVVASFSISGTISYAGAKTGNTIIRVYPSGCTGGCGSMAGTSFTSAPAAGGTAYIIRGLPAAGGGGNGNGSYQISAEIDTLGTGLLNESNPEGTSSTVNITTANATGVNFAVIDRVPSAPVTPTSINVAPGNGAAVVQYSDPQDNASEEIATSYKVYYGTDTNATNGVGSPKTFKAQGQGTDIFILKGLTNALTYFKLSAVNSIGESAATTPVSTTLGAGTGANVVSGTITFPGSATGHTLYVGAYGNSGIFFTSITSPVSPQAYSISGVPAGTYQNFAILDLNDDGEVGPPDVTNVTNHTNPPTITVNGATTGDITLVSVPTFIGVPTSVFGQSGQPNSYGLSVQVDFGTKIPISMTLISGNNVAVPYDMNADSHNANYNPIYNNSVSPTVGDVYQFLVTFSDGTTQTITSTVSAVLTSFAQNLVMQTTSPGSATVPLLTWAAPAVLPTALPYSYSVNLYNNSGTFWSYYGSGSGNGIPSSQTSVLYNTDGNASPNTPLAAGTYSWSVSVIDNNNNQNQYTRTYVAP